MSLKKSFTQEFVIFCVYIKKITKCGNSTNYYSNVKLRYTLQEGSPASPPLLAERKIKEHFFLMLIARPAVLPVSVPQLHPQTYEQRNVSELRSGVQGLGVPGGVPGQSPGFLSPQGCVP